MKSRQKEMRNRRPSSTPTSGKKEKRADDARYQRLLEGYHRGQIDELLTELQDYVQCNPKDPDGWNLLGLVHRKRLAYEDAVVCLEKAVALSPKNVLYLNNLGSIHKDRGALDQALDVFEKAIALNANDADIYYNVGLLHHSRGDYDLARHWYQKSLAIRPDFRMAQGNLVSLDKEQGKIDEALTGYRRLIEINPLDAPQWSNYLLVSHYKEDLTAEELFARHVEYGTTFESAIPSLPFPDTLDWVIRRRIRVGFVSADFRTHSVAFFLMPFLVFYDRNRFEVFLYSNGKTLDETSEKMKALADHWRNILPLSDDDAARAIQEDRIDILIDLSGHSGYNRLPIFVRKPAPIQVTWLGYPDTTGLTRIDYRISDAWTDPPGETDPLNTELLYRLPNGFLCYQAPSDCPEVSDLPMIQTGSVTFGSFNNHVKITTHTVRIWSRILQAVPGSRLVLKSSVKQDKCRIEQLRTCFASYGIDPERIIFLEFLPLTEHFRAYHQIDIALDTFPYNGTTTTCEALYMGVPVATMRGNCHAARVSAGILTRIGLNDWIASDEDELIRLVVSKAADIDGLRNLRNNLRRIMAESILMNRELFVKDLQEAFEAMWAQRCDQQMAERRASIVWIHAENQDMLNFLTGILRGIFKGVHRGTEIGTIADRQAFERFVMQALQEQQADRKPYWAGSLAYFDEMDSLAMDGTALSIGVVGTPIPDTLPKSGSIGRQSMIFPPPLAEKPSFTHRLANRLQEDAKNAIPSASSMVFAWKDWAEHPARMVRMMAARLCIDLAEEDVKRILSECPVPKGVNDAMEQKQKGSQPMHPYRWISSNEDPATSLERLASDWESGAPNTVGFHPLGIMQGQQFTGWPEDDRGDIFDVAIDTNLSMTLPKESESEASGRLLLERTLCDAEITFWKKWIEPGCNGIDVGAGYGQTTLLLASLAGEVGGVWSFETDPERFVCMHHSIQNNGLYGIRLVHAKVSDRTDSLRDRPSPLWQSPPLVALDDVSLRFRLPAIDWVRIDAGEDILRVMEGGRRFFRDHSPLIQVHFGVAVGQGTAEMINWAQENGYETYRLVPMLECLVPCRSLSEIEATQKSLFFCKPDRSVRLTTKGVLIRQDVDTQAGGLSDPTLWLEHVRHFPYAVRLLRNWESYIMENLRNPAWRVHQEAMSSYAIARMKNLSMEERWRSLLRAQLLLTDLVAKEASFARLQTMARVSMDMGLYQRATTILEYMVRMMETDTTLSIDEPFLCPCNRLESIDPKEEIGGWCLASILEAIENARTQIGEPDEKQSMERIDILRTTPFLDERLAERKAWFEKKQCLNLIDHTMGHLGNRIA